MGGSAFSAILAASSFPRLPPVVYRSLKASLLPTLGQYYRHVVVPAEGPEKVSYGDLDLLVVSPKAPYENKKRGSTTATVPHDIIKKALGATLSNEMEGNRTSNYGIPIRVGEWSAFGLAKDEERVRAEAVNGEIFYQVDVRVCADMNEWERVRFFHSYGDMGMVLGLLGRNAGLHLGLLGLRVANPPNPPFELSTSFDDIVKFFGLSMDTYNAGFQTKRAVFEWIVTSHLFDPNDFRSSGEGFTKVKKDRMMYAEFVEWVQQLKSSRGVNPDPTTNPDVRTDKHSQIRAAALDFFGKTREYELMLEEKSSRKKLKGSWSGSQVRDWTELGEYWLGVKRIMDEVRSRLGGDPGVLAYLDENGDDSLKKLVLEVKNDLGIRSTPPSDSPIVHEEGASSS